MRQSVSIAPIGYLTCALLVVVLVLGVVLVMALTPVGTYLLQHVNIFDAWGQLSDGEQELTRKLAIAFTVLGVVTLAFFSIFVGLSTHNATGLGADQPLLAPSKAATCWTRLIWTQIRITVGLLVPAGLLWEGYTIPGLIAGIVVIEIAHRHLDDAGGWLERPTRHLADLYAKMGIDSSVASPAGSVWAQCFRLANWLVICVAAMPVAGFGLYTASNLAGRSEPFGWSSSGLGLAQLAAAAIVGALAALSIASVALLAPLSFGLIQRQRTRKTLVRVGRGRSWVARPGQGDLGQMGSRGSFGQSGPAPTHYGGFEDEDRIVERRPTSAQDPSGSGIGGPGFGGPGMAGPGFNGPAFGQQRPAATPYEDPRLAGGFGPSDPGFGGGFGPGGPGQSPGGPGQGPGGPDSDRIG